MIDIILATKNRHKVVEIAEIMKDMPVRLRSLADFPDIPDIEETGDTFAENALLKARAVFQKTNLITLSDDSGLEVDALNGAPGIYSARFAGETKSAAANNAKLLRELQNMPEAKRSAQFRCVVAIVTPDFEKTVEGIVRGKIIRAPRGEAGFGYDPLFIPDGYSQTFAELGAEVKNRISHRAKAFTAAKEMLKQLISNELKDEG